MPIIASLIQGLVSPNQGGRGGRLDAFEQFLGNFATAMGTGMQAAHGPGAAFKGAGAAIGAPYQQAVQNFQLDQQTQTNQSDIQQRQAQTALTEKQTSLAGQTAMVNIPGMGMVSLPTNQIGNVLKGAGAAGISSQGRLEVEQLKGMIQTGQVAKVLDYKDPQTGQLGKMAYDRSGQQLGLLPGALPSAFYMPTSSSTIEFREDVNGNIVQLPKPTITTKGGTLASKVPALAGASQTMPTKNPSAPPASGFPNSGGPRVVMQGKSAADMGIAFNPQTNEREQVSRAESTQRGMVNFTKATEAEFDKYRMSQVMFNDMQSNVSR